MDWRIGKIIGNVVLIFISYSLTFAQPPIDRGEFWSRLQIMNHLSTKWTIGIDFQYRRQQDNHHLMDVPLLLSYRTWLVYRLPHNFQFITNPVMYLEHYRVTDGADSVLKPLIKLHELRTVWGFQHELNFKIIELRNRLLSEFRWMNFDEKQGSFRFRWRYQFLFSVLLTRLSNYSTMHVQFFDEIFFQPDTITDPNTGSNLHRIFDQNRVTMSLLTRVYAVELQLGFQYTYQLSGFKTFNKYQLLTGLLIRL